MVQVYNLLSIIGKWREKLSFARIQSAIEGQAGKEYTIAVRIDEIKTDGEETARVRAAPVFQINLLKLHLFLRCVEHLQIIDQQCIGLEDVVIPI